MLYFFTKNDVSYREKGKRDKNDKNKILNCMATNSQQVTLESHQI